MQDLKRNTQKAYDQWWHNTSVRSEPEESSDLQQEGFVQITTPFQDRYGEYVVVHVRKDVQGYYFTDDAVAYNDYLGSSGDLDRPYFEEAVRYVCAYDDVRLDENDRVIVHVPKKEYSEGLRSIITIILVMGGFAAHAERDNLW